MWWRMFYLHFTKTSTTVDSLYLELSLSRTSLYLGLKYRSLSVGCNLFFSLYLELALSRTNSLVPCKFEIERVNCISIHPLSPPL